MGSRRGSTRALAGLAVAAVLLGACGDDASQVSTATTASSPTTESTSTTTTVETTTSQTTTSTTEVVSPAEAKARARLASAANSVAEMGSGRFELAMAITGVPEIGDMVLSLSGSFTADGKAHLQINAGTLFDAIIASDPTMADDPSMAAMAALLAEPVDVIVDTDSVYFSAELLEALMATPMPTPWVSLPIEESAEDVAPVEIPAIDDPLVLLELLSESGMDVEELGAKEINGVMADGFLVTLDVESFANLMVEEFGMAEEEFDMSDVPPEMIEARFPLEVWLSSDGIPVRLGMELSEELLASLDETGEMSGTSVMVSMDLLDLGQEIEIEIPDPSDVTPLENFDNLLNGLMGQAGLPPIDS